MSLGQPLSQLMTGVLLKQNKQGTSLHKPSAGESGGNIKMGSTGPNNPITGVPTAPATCTGPESMEIIKSQLAISATISAPLSRLANDFTPVKWSYSEDPSPVLIPNCMITALYSEWILFISF